MKTFATRKTWYTHKFLKLSISYILFLVWWELSLVKYFHPALVIQFTWRQNISYTISTCSKDTYFSSTSEFIFQSQFLFSTSTLSRLCEKEVVVSWIYFWLIVILLFISTLIVLLNYIHCDFLISSTLTGWHHRGGRSLLQAEVNQIAVYRARSRPAL